MKKGESRRKYRGGEEDFKSGAHGRQPPAPTNQKTVSQPHTTSSWPFSPSTLGYKSINIFFPYCTLFEFIQSPLNLPEILRVVYSPGCSTLWFLGPMRDGLVGQQTLRCTMLSINRRTRRLLCYRNCSLRKKKRLVLGCTETSGSVTVTWPTCWSTNSSQGQPSPIHIHLLCYLHLYYIPIKLVADG